MQLRRLGAAIDKLFAHKASGKTAGSKAKATKQKAATKQFRPKRASARD